MTDTVSDKPWTFTGFGTIRCGRHTVLHLDQNLSDEVPREEFEKVGRLAAAAPKLHQLTDRLLRLLAVDEYNAVTGIHSAETDLATSDLKLLIDQVEGKK